MFLCPSLAWVRLWESCAYPRIAEHNIQALLFQIRKWKRRGKGWMSHGCEFFCGKTQGVSQRLCRSKQAFESQCRNERQVFKSPNHPIAPSLNEPYSSGGNSKSTRLPRKPLVFHAPTAIPNAIQIAPKTSAFGLRLIHRKKQM